MEPIKKVTAGITGQEAADLLYENDNNIPRLDTGLTVSKAVVVNPNIVFTSTQVKALTVIKSVDIFNADVNNKYAIQTLCGPAYTQAPGRIWIAQVLPTSTPLVVNSVLKIDSLATKTVLTGTNGEIFEITADWSGFETSDIILNAAVSENMILSKDCFKDYARGEDLTEISDKVTEVYDEVSVLEEDFTGIVDKSELTGWVDSVNSMSVVNYGAETLKSWGFPIGVRRNITALQLFGNTYESTEVRIRIKKEDYTGEVLYDKRFTLPSTKLIDLGETIENADGSRLYLETFYNGRSQVQRTGATATIYTAEKGYARLMWSTADNSIDTGILSNNSGNMDIKVLIYCEYSKYLVRPEVLPPVEDGENINLIKKNLRISCAGSSVTWGTGFLQDSMLAVLIPLLQKSRTRFISPTDISVNGASTILNTVNDRLLFDRQAVQLTGANSTIDLDIDGDEISIVQAIQRTNNAASEIEMYVDGVLYDTISNYNPTDLGHELKTFTAVTNQKEFPLGRPFTYNHVVKVNGVTQTVTLNKGTTMPSSGWAVARDIMTIDGQTIVQHTLFSPTALIAGDVVTCEYDYGAELRYERTTIGKDGGGALESAYGRGYTPFDPANPGSAAFGSGLDFRETDERVIKKYTFNESKLRHVQLKVKGLDPRATSNGTPYFIFNFATSRILYFQNAGIGGWKSSQFNDNPPSNGNILRTWREIVDFQPDYIFYESTPNDDWGVYGYKLYTSFDNLTLAQLQAFRTLPNKLIQYNASGDNYTYQKYCGTISAINKNTVQLSPDTQIVTDPAEGDSVVLGTYYSDNKQYVTRLVRSYDSSTRTVTFDRPINARDFVLSDLSDFVGKEIQIRDLSNYTSPTVELLAKFESYGNSPKVGLVPNPAPNMRSRDLAAYFPLLEALSHQAENRFFVGVTNVYDWQYSQVRDRTITVNAADLVAQPDGTKRLDLTDLTKGNNFMNYAVLVNGVDVANKDAFVLTSYALGVDRTLTGTALNDNATRGKQVWGNFYPTLVFTRNAPTTGTITVKCTTNLWSSDSCHVNGNSQKLYAIDYAKFIE